VRQSLCQPISCSAIAMKGISATDVTWVCWSLLAALSGRNIFQSWHRRGLRRQAWADLLEAHILCPRS
jgi:hypothetical protein